MMKHITTLQNEVIHTEKMTTSLRDGLIALSGIGIAAGSLLNAEITMWFLGA